MSELSKAMMSEPTAPTTACTHHSMIETEIGPCCVRCGKSSARVEEDRALRVAPCSEPGSPNHVWGKTPLGDRCVRCGEWGPHETHPSLNANANATMGPMIAKDPWAHRSANMKCSTCMWFASKEPHPNLGRCRRHAPTLSGYPAVFKTDWCGDHKMDETKL